MTHNFFICLVLLFFFKKLHIKVFVYNNITDDFLQLFIMTFLGLSNLEALKNIISNQQMKYDFTYYAMDYETQIPVLTLSIGKSILPVT